MLNQIKTAFYLGTLFALFLGFGFLLGGTTGLTIGFAIALVLNVGMYWYSDKLVLKMYRAKEADEEKFGFLYEMVRELSEKANLPMPKVYIVEKDNPNAFATGRNPENAAVAVTTGILRILNPRELRGVIAHEMSHIKNRDILVSTIAAVIAGAISYVAMMARFGAIFGGGDDNGGVIGMIVLSILAPLIAAIVSFAISRSREYLADSTGASLCKDPIALADALQKLHAGSKNKPMKNANPATSHMFIVNPFNAKSLFTLFSTHPPVAKRVGKLRAMAVNH